MQWSQDVINRGGAPPIRIDTITTSESQQRTQTQTSINVSTGRIDNTSMVTALLTSSLLDDAYYPRLLCLSPEAQHPHTPSLTTK